MFACTGARFATEYRERLNGSYKPRRLNSSRERARLHRASACVKYNGFAVAEIVIKFNQRVCRLTALDFGFDAAT